MILAASGIILQNKKILLLQRSHYTKNYPEFWGCPGGRAEQNETAEQNVIREVKEECNLDFTPTTILKTLMPKWPRIEKRESVWCISINQVGSDTCSNIRWPLGRTVHYLLRVWLNLQVNGPYRLCRLLCSRTILQA